tara:strand:- start:1399 stop:1680 length:282 start_codon:yes stop_codon:yes gene_type:complete
MNDVTHDAERVIILVEAIPQPWRDIIKKLMDERDAALSALPPQEVSDTPTHWMVSGNNMMVGCWESKAMARAIAEEKPYYVVTPMRALSGETT